MEKFEWMEEARPGRFFMDPAGMMFVLPGAFLSVFFAAMRWEYPAVIAFVLTAFCFFFFRDPHRPTPIDPTAIIAPADGKVIKVIENATCPYLEGPCVQISIFMNVFNVHVNRAVTTGRVCKTLYHPGKFFSANLDKASRENEHNAVYIEDEQNRIFCMVQVAGLIARRIICRVKKEDFLSRGQRFGVICFGSRVDVYMPASVSPKVKVGEKTRAGETIIGQLS